MQKEGKHTCLVLLILLEGDLELRTSPSGTQYMNFNLAVNLGYGDKQRANFYQCWLNGEKAEGIIKAKVQKGSLLTLVGELEIVTYEKDGKKYTTPKVNVLSWNYVPVGQKQDGDTAENKNSAKSQPNTTIDDIPVDDVENDLPFY